MNYLYSFHGGTKPLLQFGKFAAKVCVVTDQLLMHLGQLIQVVLKEGYFLFLSK